MNKVKIVTKKEANNLILDSLFKPINGRTLMCTQHLQTRFPSNANKFVGEYWNAPESVYAFYFERKKDKYGSYMALFCVYSA